MRELRRFATILIICLASSFIWALSSVSYNASLTLLENKLEAVRGYLEGKIADLESEVETKMYGLEKKVENVEDAIKAIKNVLKGLNDTLSTIYENQKVLTELVKSLSEGLKKLDERVANNTKALAKLETSEKEDTEKWILYGFMGLSILNTLLILILYLR